MGPTGQTITPPGAYLQHPAGYKDREKSSDKSGSLFGDKSGDKSSGKDKSGGLFGSKDKDKSKDKDTVDKGEWQGKEAQPEATGFMASSHGTGHGTMSSYGTTGQSSSSVLGSKTSDVFTGPGHHRAGEAGDKSSSLLGKERPPETGYQSMTSSSSGNLTSSSSGNIAGPGATIAGIPPADQTPSYAYIAGQGHRHTGDTATSSQGISSKAADTVGKGLQRMGQEAQATGTAMRQQAGDMQAGQQKGVAGKDVKRT